jgi:hypothetical protein
MDLKSEIKYWLIEERIGLISKDELIQRVDKKILELDNPPSYLVDISIITLELEDELNLNLTNIDHDQILKIAERLLSLFKSNSISLTELGVHSYKLSCLIDPNNDSRTILNWIDDEIQLINQTVKPRKESENEILKKLNQLVAL